MRMLKMYPLHARCFWLVDTINNFWIYHNMVTNAEYVDEELLSSEYVVTRSLRDGALLTPKSPFYISTEVTPVFLEIVFNLFTACNFFIQFYHIYTHAIWIKNTVAIRFIQNIIFKYCMFFLSLHWISIYDLCLITVSSLFFHLNHMPFKTKIMCLKPSTNPDIGEKYLYHRNSMWKCKIPQINCVLITLNFLKNR
jgi:hypothetical protein